MRITPIVCLAAFAGALSACQPSTDTTTTEPATEPGVVTPPPPAANQLTAAGWGPLRIGMTLEEVTTAAGPDSDPESVGGPEPEACDQFRPAEAPEGLLVMIENGVLTRISLIDSSALRTDRGFGLGDQGAAIKAGYGASAIVVEPHHYVGTPAEYITAWSTATQPTEYVQDAAARGIRYETNAEGVVTVIHAGGPSIPYVEGCA